MSVTHGPSTPISHRSARRGASRRPATRRPTPAAPGSAPERNTPTDDQAGARGSAAYRALLTQPGARRLVAAGLLARLPVGMTGVGGMLLVAATTGSYRLAGLATAAIALAGAAAGPTVSRRIDRRGPRAVLPLLAGAHVCAGVCFVVAALLGAPVALLLAAAVATGATLPQVGPIARRRWADRLGGGPLLVAAYALEATLDTLTFLAGPTLASALAGLTPSAGSAAALLLVAVGTAAFVTLPAPAASASADGHRPARGARSVLRIPGFVPVLATSMALGIFFGSTDVALVAYARAHGWGPAAGLLPTLLTASNLLAGLAYGAVRWRSGVLRRFALGGCLLAVVSAAVPLAVAGGAGAVVAAVVLAGPPLAPVLVSESAIIGSLVPAHRRTEGFSWTVIASSVGVSAGAPLAGVLVDQAGTNTALAVFPIGGCAVAVGALLAARLRAVPAAMGSARPADPIAQS